MIIYSVQCSQGHGFDEWFDNSADYDAKALAHAIVCPTCGDTHITKGIMAPNVAKASAAAPMPSCSAPGGCAGGGCAFANGF
jgi:hypothetical protein